MGTARRQHGAVSVTRGRNHQQDSTPHGPAEPSRRTFLRAGAGVSDSRVPPEIIFDEGIGDLFTMRIAGNTRVDGDRAGQHRVRQRGARQRAGDVLALEPVLAPAVRAGKVTVVGAEYHFTTGAVDIVT